MKSNQTARILFTCAFLLIAPGFASANGLRVETLRTQVITDGPARLLRVDARVQWRNAWRNARNHDAAWLIVKVRGNPRAGWSHAHIGRAVAANSGGAPVCTSHGRSHRHVLRAECAVPR